MNLLERSLMKHISERSPVEHVAATVWFIRILPRAALNDLSDIRHPLVRDWRPRHVLKVGHTTGARYCHQHGRGASWPCPEATRMDRWIVRLGGRSR